MSDASPRPLRELGDVSVAKLRHIGEKRTTALASMGIENVFDLITYYPRLHVDRTRRAELSELSVGDTAAVLGEVTKVSARRTRQGRALVEVSVSDDGGSFRVVFFNQAWRERQLGVGTQALFFGTLGEYRGTRQMTNPLVDVIVGPSGEERDPSRVGRVVSIYPASGKAGLTSWELGGFIEESLRRAGPLLDPLDAATRTRYELIDRTAAYFQIHLPRELADVAPARRRLVFDELLRLQVLIALRRRHLERLARGVAHPVSLEDLDVRPGAPTRASDSLVKRFLAQHEFAPTSAQRRVLEEIFTDLAGTVPMNRLLQGDVGSGKTLVSLVALLGVIDQGRQGAILVPTEVLAEQHVAALRRDVEGLVVTDERVLGGARPLNVALLSGRLRAKERQQVLAGVASGSVDVVVGTHALLSDDVRFRALGLLVIDEQHRFGVEQRATLRDEGRERSDEGRDPDLLVMTATPIPRTAAMVLFGDLDLSVIDEMPAGRRAIETRTATTSSEVQRCWQHVRDEVGAGRRAFVVCALVEGSERIEATNAVDERTRLALNELRGLSVGLLHGQMKSDEKEAVMASFRSGELDVLVATVVIEVGVDVPDATVIVIEDAWRFGLAQLHQLRGRVGRSDRQSYCYLLGDAPSDEAARRLDALVHSNDGFALAEIDLELRGEGTLLGARQQGRSDLRLADLRRDEALVHDAQDLARAMVAENSVALATIEDELRLFVDEVEATYLFKS
ncbi:MAG TPA: ATP-dependent DNA helicase RecG [Acidimicrobiales bacterium]|nr:MAG: ATP-dependent DNA helicase RecG [Actinobacteria bacterium 21-64-8]HQT98972.1 ATP-dependent DNA helicase RecG [Acidimicrobiales bacterium]